MKDYLEEFFFLHWSSSSWITKYNLSHHFPIAAWINVRGNLSYSHNKRALRMFWLLCCLTFKFLNFPQMQQSKRFKSGEEEGHSWCSVNFELGAVALDRFDAAGSSSNIELFLGYNLSACDNKYVANISRLQYSGLIFSLLSMNFKSNFPLRDTAAQTLTEFLF